jgi:hypothetical protein
MKALCVKQPWAKFIAEGTKTIETRTWPTSYRGPLVIVASKTPDRDALAYFGLTKEDCGQFGVAVCIVNLVDCRPMTFGDETPACCDVYERAFSWVLQDIKHIAPYPVNGQLGLFDVCIPEKYRVGF